MEYVIAILIGVLIVGIFWMMTMDLSRKIKYMNRRGYEYLPVFAAFKEIGQEYHGDLDSTEHVYCNAHKKTLVEERIVINENIIELAAYLDKIERR